MHLLNYKQLARDLRDNKVSEREKFSYVIGLLILSAPLLVPTTPINAHDITADLISAFVFILIMIAGTVLLYRKNQQGDGKNFLERYICLSFPIGIISGFLGIMSILITSGIVMAITHQTILSDMSWEIISDTMSVLTMVVSLALFYESITLASSHDKKKMM